MTTARPSKQRRSLRQNLRHLLRFISNRPQKTQTIGSGILRRDPSSISHPPSITSTALFPAFGSSQSDLDLEPAYPDTPDTPTTCTTFSSPRPTSHSLLPATSLSHFNLRGAYLRQAPPPQQVAFASVNDTYRPGASHHASLTTLPPSNFGRSASAFGKSASTLRLRPSFVTSAPSSATFSLETLSTLFPGSKISLNHPGSDSPAFQEPYAPPESRNRGQPIRVHARSPQWDPLSVVRHFQSFCVLDTAVPGAPVTATSGELRYIFEIGEQFFLNNHECKEASMDLVIGSDAAGNQVTHLVLFSPLVSPSSGRSRFMLAALVDVTEFISEAASLPSLDPVSEDDSVGDEIATPILSASALDRWAAPFPGTLQLSAEDLLGGCFISDQSQSRPGQKQTDDIWLDLAATESKPNSSPRRTPARKAANRTRPSLSTSSSATDASVDDVLDQFVTSLQSLYSDFFLLGKNPLDDSVYEICNVSPKVYAGKEYADGHLSKTSREVIAELSFNLARDRPFSAHLMTKYQRYVMFAETFSFGASSSSSINFDDYVPPEISPCTSRPATPAHVVNFSAHQLSFSRRNSLLDNYQSSLPPSSVMALTTQLKHHAIQDRSPSDSPDSALSPDLTARIDQDEGFYDGPHSPGTDYSDGLDFDPTLWDLSQMSATSSPRPSLSLQAQAVSSYTQRRRQRQALVRLQCIAQRAPDLAMLIEERHPSSLPLACEVLCTKRRSGGTADSVRGNSTLSRVEKPGCSCVKKPIKMRKRASR
ncbi:hypothetical protein DV738_g3872, partial [Chaetothyriales sp. CBS 135597]